MYLFTHITLSYYPVAIRRTNQSNYFSNFVTFPRFLVTLIHILSKFLQ